MSTVYCMAIAAMLLILGGAAGAVILGLCYVSSRADEQQEKDDPQGNHERQAAVRIEKERPITAL